MHSLSKHKTLNINDRILSNLHKLSREKINLPAVEARSELTEDL